MFSSFLFALMLFAFPPSDGLHPGAGPASIAMTGAVQPPPPPPPPPPMHCPCVIWNKAW